MLTYLIFNHQNKGDAFKKALDQKYKEVLRDPVDIVFSDQAIYGRVQRLRKLNAKYNFIFPHAAHPNLMNDMVPVWDEVTAEFVVTECHKDVMQIYGYNKPIHAVGWGLCELREYKPRPPINVLFAPIHPRCADIDMDANRETFELLRDLDIKLTVRYLGDIAENGLEKVEQANIEYTQGEYEPSVEQIDRADVVVAHETFLYLAVARGVPTVGFNEDIPTHLIPRGVPTVYPNNWKKYLHLVRYPIDIKDGHPMDMLEMAAKSDESIKKWRMDMIGDMEFDDKLFHKYMEGYVEG